MLTLAASEHQHIAMTWNMPCNAMACMSNYIRPFCSASISVGQKASVMEMVWQHSNLQHESFHKGVPVIGVHGDDTWQWSMMLILDGGLWWLKMRCLVYVRWMYYFIYFQIFWFKGNEDCIIVNLWGFRLFQVCLF